MSENSIASRILATMREVRKGKNKNENENKKRPLSTPEKQQVSKKVAFGKVRELRAVDLANEVSSGEESTSEKEEYDMEEEDESEEDEENQNTDITETVKQKITLITKCSMTVADAIDAMKETINADEKIAESTKRVLNRQLRKILEATNELQLANAADLAATEERKIWQKRNAEATAKIRQTLKKVESAVEQKKNDRPSYAEKLKVSTAKIPKKVSRISEPVLLVYPPESEPQQTSDQTKEKLKKAINPVQKGLKIDGIRRIGKGGVALQTENKKQLAQLAKVLEKEGLKTKKPSRLRPNIIIYDVPDEIKKEDLNAAIRSQNYPEVDQSFFDERVKPAFGIRRKGRNTTNWVMEVDPYVRAGILELGKLYIDFSSCKVEDYVRITRCYNCQQFGHTTKNCKNTKTCSICAAENHSHRECKIPENKAVCKNCKMFNRPHNHSVRSIECPYYQQLIKKKKERTDYFIDYEMIDNE